jgi:heme/copper-type cytochrome/quinol oxidase subunit 3
MMEKNKMGMAFFLASEAVFFLLLIIAYIHFHDTIAQGPTAASSLSPATTFIFSLFLFASSGTVGQASKSLRQGNQSRARLWLAITILFGAIFLLGQGLEWGRLIRQGTFISSNLFGTTFFTLTGFHGLHVMIGLVALCVLLGLFLAGMLHGPESAALETISLYWHFVDGVWVVIFVVIYMTILLHL